MLDKMLSFYMLLPATGSEASRLPLSAGNVLAGGKGVNLIT